MPEVIRFILFCALLALGLGFMLSALIGVNRFGFSLNRLHAASIGDTMGLGCIVLACAVKAGLDAVTLKFLLVYAFMLLTSPMSGHLIGLLVYRTDRSISREAGIWKP